MNENPGTKVCVVCGRGAGVAPLINFEYLQSSLWICTQHLPLLIHSPDQLVGKLPGAENLAPAEGHD
jgi:hypothetical protein